MITETIHANEDTLSVKVAAEQFISEDINLHNYHRYHDGHIEGAADPAFNDSDWQTGSQMSLSTSNLPDSWTGIRGIVYVLMWIIRLEIKQWHYN